MSRTPAIYPEVPDEIDVINPLASGARNLIGSLVEEVVSATPGVRRFHLGGDEAWTFGTHAETRAFIERQGKGALYLHHVGPILDALNSAGIRPQLWHDMMKDWDNGSLTELGRKSDLVLWGYSGHPERDMGEHINETIIIERFKANGITMWGATAWSRYSHSTVQCARGRKEQ